MIVLLGFAFLAGAGTALSPCVLPVLPALLASGGVGGRRRPLGVVIGLTVTFTVVIVGVANVVDGVGTRLGPAARHRRRGAARLRSGADRAGPGRPPGGAHVADRGARVGRARRGDGFRSGLLVGGALGFVYTPCAGPILAAVISVSAASGRTVAVAIAYSLGSAAVLFALDARRAQAVRSRARGRDAGRRCSARSAIVMIVTAVAIVVGVDVDFDQYVAEHIPNVNLTAGLEKSKAVESRLPQVTGHTAKFVSGSKTATAPRNASQATLLADAAKLKNLGPAPEFADTEDWFNTPGAHQPLTAQRACAGKWC